MQKITPCFWFNNQADEAVAYYLSIFNDSSIKETSHYTDEGPGQKGTTLAITFQLNGQEFMAINGGPEYQFTPALSLYVSCEDQDQVDYYWEKLSEGGEKGPCGWLTDKYGVSWQIVPTVMSLYLSDKDERKVANVMRVMLKMTKLDIEGLRAAYEKE